MIYRELGNTGMKISEVSLGCEHLENQPYEAVDAVVSEALNLGMNGLDIFMTEPNVRSYIGRSLKGRRDKAILQGHIADAWIDGQYQRVTDRPTSEKFVKDFLTRLDTDYIDIGMIHYVDTPERLDALESNGIIDLALELKQKGIIRAVGFSSHDPITAAKAVEHGWAEVCMFSVNPCYDVMPGDIIFDDLFLDETYAKKEKFSAVPERDAFYQICQQHNVGITVMKATAAARLLKAETSPFGTAMTVGQCIHYALTRPAVSSVMLGCRKPEEVQAAAAYETLSDAERDYASVLSKVQRFSIEGKCMYCNHCLPCPAQIDVAQVNRFLDLATMTDAVPATVKEHYLSMAHTASECLQCGSCESNCPFAVKVTERMAKAVEVFGK